MRMDLLGTTDIETIQAGTWYHDPLANGTFKAAGIFTCSPETANAASQLLSFSYENKSQQGGG